MAHANPAPHAMGTETPPPAAPASECARCHALFRCGMAAGDAQCWCYSLPHVLAVPATTAQAACLCPTCLQALMDRHE